MNDQYRFDKRSKEQFEEDIKTAHNVENDILKKWLLLIGNPKFEYNGCGPDGRYLDIKKTNTKTDFIVDGVGPLEVKFSKKHIKTHFHLKIDHVESYIKQEATLLMAMGIETESPKFTLINTAELKKIKDKCKIVPWTGFGGKASFAVPIKTFLWRPLNNEI